MWCRGEARPTRADRPPRDSAFAVSARQRDANADAPVRAVDRFLRHDMSTYAAALAYRALLALFPFVIFVMGLVNALDAPRLFEMLADWARAEPTNVCRARFASGS